MAKKGSRKDDADLLLRPEPPAKRKKVSRLKITGLGIAARITAVLTAICGVESTAVSGRIGKRLVTHFLLYSTLFTVVTMFLSQFCFNLPVGEVNLSQREVSGVLDFFLDVLPGDILSPFIHGDFTQLIIIALILGNAFMDNYEDPSVHSKIKR